MSVHNQPQSIYHFQICTLDDIEQAINDNEVVKQKVAKILDSNPHFSIERAVNALDIGDIFQKAYYETLGFNTCLGIVEQVHCYRALLITSITACNDILTPLIIRSIKCYQTAFQHFTMSEQQRGVAIAAMAESVEISKTIADEYDKLRKRFELLRNSVSDLQVSAVANRPPIYRKLETCPEDSKPILQAGISSLDNACNSFGIILTDLANVSLFWNIAHSRCGYLTDPMLADPIMVDDMLLEDTTRPAKDDQIFKELEIVEKSIDKHMAAPRQKSTLTEVVQFMKTGRNTTASDASPKGLVAEVLRLPFTIEEMFENSYLNWLALARINQAMVTALRKTVIKIEQYQNNISETERNPLTIALRL